MEYLLKERQVKITSDYQIIETLCSAFKDNRRMQLLIGRVNTFPQRLQTIVTYCFYLAKKIGGIVSSTCRNTHLVYYQKSKMYHSIGDSLRYLLVALFAIRLTRLWTVFKREQRVKSIRKREISKQNERDYLYVWFLAQKKNYKRLDGLVEVKNHLIAEAKMLMLPIYMETTEHRLLPLYERVGFQFYHSLQLSENGMTIWFGRYDPNILNSEK